MFRVVINIFLLVVIAGVGWFIIAPNIICWQEGGVWSFEKRVCDIGTVVVPSEDLMPKIAHIPRFDFSKLKEIIITVPNAEKTTATLSRTNDALGRFMATFTQQGSKVDGTAEALATLSATDDLTGIHLIPFVVNFGGTGSFIYLGLFEQGTSTLIHRDSVLVGDRANIEKISFERSGDTLKAIVLYKDRKSTDSLTETPTVPKKLVVDILVKKFGTSTIYDRPVAYVVTYKDLVKIQTPAPQSAVSSPIGLQGIARGSWFFEASFPISVVDAKGKVIGTGVGTADGNWMTPEFVPFTARIEFIKGYARTGNILLKKDNPSGMPENDDSFEIPVTFK